MRKHNLFLHKCYSVIVCTDVWLFLNNPGCRRTVFLVLLVTNDGPKTQLWSEVRLTEFQRYLPTSLLCAMGKLFVKWVHDSPHVKRRNENYLHVGRLIHTYTKCSAQFTIQNGAHSMSPVSTTMVIMTWSLCQGLPRNESRHPLHQGGPAKWKSAQGFNEQNADPSTQTSLDWSEKVNEMPWKKTGFVCLILVSHLHLWR